MLPRGTERQHYGYLAVFAVTGVRTNHNTGKVPGTLQRALKTLETVEFKGVTAFKGLQGIQ